jgi:hypothetical protein
MFYPVRVTRVAAKPTHGPMRLQAATQCASVSARTSAHSTLPYSGPAMEEFFLHLWDEIDDLVGVCRHVATVTAAEVLAASAPVIAATSGALLAGAATLLLSHRQLFDVLA